MTAPGNIFVSLRTQLDNIRKWNEERGWGFSPEDLDSVDVTPPVEGKPLVVDLIAVYLDGEAELNGVRRTCHERWTVAAEQQPPPGVDVGAHCEPGRYLSASRVRSHDAAHAEVLAAAAHFPRWVGAMDGKTVPYTWLFRL